METLALVGGSNQEGRDTLSEASNSWEVVMSRLEEVGLYRMVGECEVWWALGSNLCEMEVGLCRTQQWQWPPGQTVLGAEPGRWTQ